jgi:hypothetical protein
VAYKVYHGKRWPSGSQISCDVYTSRNCEKKLETKPIQYVAYHGYTGFDWGCEGAGTADLSRCLLIDCMGEKVGGKHYKRYAELQVSGWNRSGFEVSSSHIENFIKLELDRARLEEEAAKGGQTTGIKKAPVVNYGTPIDTSVGVAVSPDRLCHSMHDLPLADTVDHRTGLSAPMQDPPPSVFGTYGRQRIGNWMWRNQEGDAIFPARRWRYDPVERAPEAAPVLGQAQFVDPHTPVAPPIPPRSYPCGGRSGDWQWMAECCGHYWYYSPVTRPAAEPNAAVRPVEQDEDRHMH